MSTPWSAAVLIGATLTTGLTAGLLFVFAHSVMPGLRTLPDVEGLRSFQRIDAAIGNPWMGLTFLGSPVLTFAALLLRLPDGGSAVVWLAVALALIMATLVVTATVHLPLNAQIQSAAPDFAGATALWERLEARWMTWNVIRTVTSVSSFICLSGALLLASPGP